MFKLGITVPLVLILFLTGCMGAVSAPPHPVNYAPPLVDQVRSLNPGSVIYGIKAVMNGYPGAKVLANETKYMFVWSYQNMSTAGFFVIDFGSKKVLTSKDVGEILKTGGNLVNSKSIKDILTCLESNGWKVIAPSAIPAAITQFIEARIISSPVLILTVSVFGSEGDFEKWFESTFLPVEVEG